MKKTATALGLLFLLASCQKEANFVDVNNQSGGGSGATSGLLVRAVQVQGTDSSAIDFRYDASGRLTRYSATVTGGSPVVFKIQRNSSGIITKTVLFSDDLATYGIDSLETNVYYSTAASRYTGTRADIDLGGMMLSDSVAFTYNSSGQISSAAEFTRFSITPYLPYGRTDYTYNADNIATVKQYEYDNNTAAFSLIGTSTYVYDAKVNPLKLGTEAVVLGMTNYAGSNNATKSDFTDPADPTNNSSQTSTYTYNSANKPATGTMVETPGPVNYTLRFYYN